MLWKTCAHEYSYARWAYGHKFFQNILQKAVRIFTIFTKQATNSPQRQNNYNELSCYQN